jgi:hypothetical protein
MGIEKEYRIELSSLDSDNVLETYHSIWQKSFNPNPFLSEKLIRLANQNNQHVQVAFFYIHNKLSGALPFYLNGFHFRMFGEEKSDGLDLIFLKEVSLQDKFELLVKLFQTLKVTSASFNKLATHSFNYILIYKAFKSLAFQSFLSVSYKNPIVKHLSDIPNFDNFLKIFSKRNTRNYCNKLAREFGYTITSIEHYEEEKVAIWMNHFYMQHIQRWNETTTESIYSYSNNQKTLNTKIEAWLKDQSGLLFSIDVNNVPIAMAICLKQGQTIIYHQISSTNLPIYRSYPKQKILILELAKWMVTKSFTRLDFGIGSESYKYEYSNFEREIVQMEFSKYRLQFSYLKSLIGFFYRKYKILQTFNNQYLKRINVVIAPVRMRLNYYLKEVQLDKTILIKKVIRAIAKEQMFFYTFNPKVTVEIIGGGCNVRKLEFMEVLNFYEKEIVLTLPKRNFYIQKVFEGIDIPYGLFDAQNELVSIAWLNRAKENEIPPLFVGSDVYSVDDCYTLRNKRGKGYYPMLISQVAKIKDKVVLIYTNDWNIASQRGILKAGFVSIAKRIKKNSKTYDWQ